MSGNDPTDQTLAVIASIFERPETKAGDQGAEAVETAAPEADQPAAEQPAAEQPVEPEPWPESWDDADGATGRTAIASDPRPSAAGDADADLSRYTRFGPGPLEALRFKWSLRRDDNGYYVDETIGPRSQAISTGPLSRDDAVALIETRERAAHKRFEALRNEIIMGPSERGYEDDEEYE